MCGQFQFSQKLDSPAMRRLSVLAEQTQVQLPDGDIAPGCLAPVLVAGPGRAQLKMMQWGFPLGDTGRPVINARAETAASKPSFSRAMEHGRCAIPTTGFYEWSRGSKPQPYRFRAGDELLYLAGLYRMFEGAPRFVVLTCPAVGQVAAVHNRQPVVLGQGELLRWLGDREAAEAILRRPGAALQGAPMEWEES